VVSVVQDQELDVLLVQESGPRRRLRELGETLGWVVCADPWAFPRRRIKNAVLIKTTAVDAVRSRLVRFSRSSLLYPRGALIADIDEAFTATSIHLGVSGPERGRHISQFLSLEEAHPGRFVVGGDLNVLPDAAGPSAIRAHATDCWQAVGEGSGFTFPSDAPRARIDYLFAGPAVEPLRVWTAGATVSDHLMVVADLELT
jgi:endonuclease/exonuclease/phosphatase family metal-dependent hydrolase